MKLGLSLEKKMGFLREFGSKLGSAMKTLIGNDPEQYVEDVDGASLTTVAAVGLKEGKINQKEAVELINAQRKNNEKAELVSQRVERDIVLTPSDKSDFRNDATMDSAQNVKVEAKPAKELENHERVPGGRDRDEKSK